METCHESCLVVAAPASSSYIDNCLFLAPLSPSCSHKISACWGTIIGACFSHTMLIPRPVMPDHPHLGACRSWAGGPLMKKCDKYRSWAGGPNVV